MNYFHPLHDDTDDNVREAVYRDASIYSLDLNQVSKMFADAGLPRSLRTLQRYCKQGHLKAARYETETGQIWYVEESSVGTRIAEIQQHNAIAAGITPPTINDTPTHGDAVSPQQSQHKTKEAATATGGVNDRHTSDDNPMSSPVSNKSDQTSDGDVSLLDFMKDQLCEKDKQLAAKDEQIASLMETHKLDRLHLKKAWEFLSSGFALPVGQERIPDIEEGEIPEPVVVKELGPEEKKRGDNRQAHDDGYRV